MEFALTVVGESGQFTSQLNNVLNFETVPYEVCIQDVVIGAGAWLNIGKDSNFGSFKIALRSRKNWIYGSIDKEFSIPVRKYADNDDFIFSLNRAMLNAIDESSKRPYK